ncbi:ExeA family protein [Primorskyibacter flagellatus]|uniref:Type II secretory pathway, component ExeA (Predicted ATPase) n=1 Tax=Primorskyibacter flagellatus TaxID=1387277 RepID=A0A1W2D655_9RHOB|nr:AAA family ATPase [Primorskyibacter flagellatus]SMC92706.1 Type II secretory pathway, component ExeA (predicted ATPase) [Primorskyibacter flagellatus]
MYIDSFNLQSRPFAIVPDPDFLVWTTQHKTVYRKLVRNVLTGANMTLFTGEVGCGKSTILQALMKATEIEKGRRVILISSRLNSAREVPQQILLSLGKPFADRSTEELAAFAIAEMARTAAEQMPPLLIIDEAQTLADDAALLLAHIAWDEPRADLRCSIILAGQPELRKLVARASMKPLADMIDDRIQVQQLPEDEIAAYVEGRLALAGYAGNRLFEGDALDEIYAYSRGTPRLINKLCDLALFCAAKQGRRTIDAAFIREVQEEWSPPGGARITSDHSHPSRDIKPLSSPPSSIARDGSKVAPRQPAALPKLPKKIAATAPGTSERPSESTSPSDPKTPHGQVVEISPAPEAEKLSENSDPSPLPRRRKTRLVLGGLAAAACAVPFVLVLNLINDPIQEPPTGSIQQAGDATRLPVPTTTKEPISAPAQTAIAPAPDTGTQPAAQELKILKQAIAAAKAEQQALEAELARQLQNLEATPSATVSHDVQREDVTNRTAQTPDKVPGKDALQSRPDAGGADTPDPASDLAAVFEPKRPPIGRVDATQAVSRSTIQPLGPDGLSKTEPPKPARLEPVRLTTNDEERLRYFRAGLDSASPRDSAINYTRAALRGHPRAAEYLGQLFDTGDGVALASEIAQRWYAVADDADTVFQTEIAPGSIAAGQQSVRPLTVFVTDGTAEFIWEGNADLFSVELADQDKTLIGLAASPLTALSVKLPEQAAFWRVTTGSGASFDWQAIPFQND